MTDATARRLTVAQLIRELRSVGDALFNAGGTDDSAHGELIRQAGDDVRRANTRLERAMAAMQSQRCARLGQRGPRRSIWPAVRAQLAAAGLAFGLIAGVLLLDWAAGVLTR